MSIFLWFLFWTVVCWFVYMLVMRMKKHREVILEEYGKGIYTLLYIFIVIPALLLDVYYNIIWGTLLFLDPPRELLLTSRLKRYRMTAKTAHWRWKIATFICVKMLNPFDADHC